MENEQAEKWDERYRRDEFVYCEVPNQYLKEQLEKLKAGKILFPAEGEGRNAVFAAKSGWIVSAFDISIEGQKKAMRLAAKNNVKIDYQVGELHTLDYQNEHFDVIALIYAHFPPVIRTSLHKTLGKLLKKGGTVILEAYSKDQIDHLIRNENAGGPKNIDLLYSPDEIRSDFNNYDIEELYKTEEMLNEGIFHNGIGSLIRFVGKKL